jgi:hypothetical protein
MFLVLSAAAFGQAYKGSVRVNVTTGDGAPLPGAVATLSSSTFNRSFVTDANGEVRFVGLTPDRYELKVVMTGFNTVVRPNVIVDTGANIRLSVVMEPAAQAEELVVTAESPLMDTTKVGTATVLSTEEIDMIPQARDPWAVLDSIPGLQTDRINVGGNESGQQAQWVGKGDDGDNAAWIIDGVEFTDFAAQGASQSYLDFSSFSQIGFETGGAGVETGSGGTVLNFVTKQGSNRHTGSMRLLWADENFVSTNVNKNDPANINPDGSLKQNTVFETFEKGFEIGGPIIKDRLWYWGSFNQNNIKNIVRTGQRDDTDLENVSVKIHGDVTSTTRVTAFYTEGDKLKFGRGAGPTRAPETTWNQDGPSPIYKFEVSQLIGQHTELQLILGRVDGGFALTPVGDNQTIQAVYNELAGRWENTLRTDSNIRPQRSYNLKGSTFLSAGGSDHEFKYGFEYKEATSNYRGTWGQGSGNVWLDDYSAFPGVPSFFRAYRDSATSSAIEAYNIYVQDTVTFGNWTVKGGLRYNKSEGNNLGAAIDANPFYPEAVPALAYGGDSPQFTWDTIAPQVSATYTFGADNQYLVRSSYRIYYDNIAVGDVNFINPVGFGRILGYWTDTNGDTQFTPDEGSFPNDDPYAFTPLGINPTDPAGATSRDAIDPNLDPPRTNEFILGGEWAITPGFTVGAAYTYRVRDHELWTPLNDITSADYEIIGYAEGVNPINGQAYRVPQYALSQEGRAKNPFLDQTLTNRPDYEEIFHGLEFTVTKRLSNRWMMRGHLSWQDWTHDVGPNGFQSPNLDPGRSNVDGGEVLLSSAGSGSKGDVYLGSASYTAYLNGVYQLPWDVAISGSLTAREGYVAPLSHNAQNRDYRGVTTTTALSIGEPDVLRMDDIFFVNLKLTKVFTLGSTKVDLGVEVFNLFNDDATIQVQRGVATGTTQLTSFGRVNETLAPRLTRFSATVNF